MYCISANDNVGVDIFVKEFAVRLWGFHGILVKPDVLAEELLAMCADFQILLKEPVPVRRSGLRTNCVHDDCKTISPQ